MYVLKHENGQYVRKGATGTHNDDLTPKKAVNEAMTFTGFSDVVRFLLDAEDRNYNNSFFSLVAVETRLSEVGETVFP